MLNLPALLLKKLQFGIIFSPSKAEVLNFFEPLDNCSILTQACEHNHKMAATGGDANHKMFINLKVKLCLSGFLLKQLYY